MKRIVADAAARFDWVIVDSPPVGVLADARLVVGDGGRRASSSSGPASTRFPDLEAAAGRDRATSGSSASSSTPSIRPKSAARTTTAATTDAIGDKR